MEHAGRNGEQVDVECAEASRLEDQCNVCSGRCLRYVGEQADNVERPQVVVLDGFPEASWRNGLAIMHVTLAGVVAQHAVDDNGDLAIRKPALGAVPGLGLDSRCGHEEE